MPWFEERTDPRELIPTYTLGPYVVYNAQLKTLKNGCHLTLYAQYFSSNELRYVSFSVTNMLVPDDSKA